MDVFNDPIRESQMYVRRAANLLHKKGVLKVGPNHKAPRLGGEASEEFFANGERQVAKLARDIEALTGFTFESKRALDFGCGVGRMALPLAGRCEHVYGLDVSHPALDAADKRAKRLHVNNVEWMDADRLGELGGRYDLVQSLLVFQHIPSREGERILDTIVRGLRPGGVGAIQFTLRPSRPVAGFVHSLRTARSSTHNPFSSRSITVNPFSSYPYMLIHSYSLNRLCKLLADAGAFNSHVRWHPPAGAHDVATVIFQKRKPKLKPQGAAGQANGLAQAADAGAASPDDDASAPDGGGAQ